MTSNTSTNNGGDGFIGGGPPLVHLIKREHSSEDDEAELGHALDHCAVTIGAVRVNFNDAQFLVIKAEQQDQGEEFCDNFTIKSEDHLVSETEQELHLNQTSSSSSTLQHRSLLPEEYGNEGNAIPVLIANVKKEEPSDSEQFKSAVHNNVATGIMESPGINLSQTPNLEIGSRNSAFQPYKGLTILTNLQRGNVKTLCRDPVPTHPFTFQEKAAKGILTEEEIDGSEDVDAMDPEGLTALMWAAFHGKLPTLQLLISRGADVKSEGPDGQTALMFAAVKGHIEVLDCLVSHGAIVEAEDEYGSTALMHAVNYNQSQSVAQLLSHGASVTKQNFIGDNAFDICVRKGNKACQIVMEQHLKATLENEIMVFGSSNNHALATATNSQN